MATILELAQMSSNVMGGTSSAVQNVSLTGALLKGLTNWAVIANSNAVPNTAYWADGYFGVAYRNTVTGEIVVANRGTVPPGGGDLSTTLKNLKTDYQLAKLAPTRVQTDAGAFALWVLANLPSTQQMFPSFIETGHSLGGNEAQAALAFLVDGKHISNTRISAVLFNSPGIGGYRISGSPTDYNVVDLYSQGDAIHLAGGVHLGGTGNLVNLAAGPDTSRLAVLAPNAVTAGPLGVLGLSGVALAQILGPAHAISTLIEYLTGLGSATGTFNWTSNSSAALVPGSVVNTTFPFFSVDVNGNIVITDPVSNLSGTYALSSDGQTITATYSGGNSAVGQALGSLGPVSVPLSEFGQSLTNLTGATAVNETISRNAANNFNVTFQDRFDQFMVTASNQAAVFAYATPNPGQTLVLTVDNGVSNSAGSVEVLGAGIVTLTGGSAVAGQPLKWASNGNQYSFAPASPGSAVGTMTITNSSWGSVGDSIVIKNFNLNVAEFASGGYLGLVLGAGLRVTANALHGANGPAPFLAGSEQAYTVSVDAAFVTTQTVALTLSNLIAGDFQVWQGTTPVALNGDGTFTLSLPAGASSVSFTLINTTPETQSSTPVLTASISSSGVTAVSTPLVICYSGVPSNTSTAPQTNSVPNGSTNQTTQTTTYIGDGANDLVIGATANNIISLSNSFDDNITGGSGKNTISSGTGNNVINLNGTNDKVLLGGAYNTVNGGTDLTTGTIKIENFNLLQAESSSGFLRIKIPLGVYLTAGATVGTDPPAQFPAGSEQSYTISVDAAFTTLQTVMLTLSGVNAGDFEAFQGTTPITLNAGVTTTTFDVHKCSWDNFKFDPTIYIVDLNQQTTVQTIKVDVGGTVGVGGPSAPGNPIAWSPDGLRIAFVGNGHYDEAKGKSPGAELYILDAKAGKTLSHLVIEGAGNPNICYSPDGRHYIESDANGKGTGIGVRIWDVQREHLLQHLAIGDVGSISVSRDGKYLAAGTTGRTIVYQLK